MQLQPPVDIAKWRDGVRGRPLRDLVAYHLARQDRRTRLEAIDGTIAMLPHKVRGSVRSNASAIAQSASQAEFWRTDCVAFYDALARLFAERMGELNITSDSEDQFNAFNATVMRLALEVESNDTVRRAARLHRPFPWGSTLGLVYELAMYLRVRHGAPSEMAAAGVGVANLGYLLLAAGLVAGTFRAFLLTSRVAVFTAAAAFFALGVWMVNYG